MNRQEELRRNLQDLEERISQSCNTSKRERKDITLIAVTKNFPASDIEILYELGIQDVGENRDQEASAKFAQVKKTLTWHFIGQLQSNKVKSVVKYCNFIHSVDRISLAKEISKQAQLIKKTIKIFLQIDLAPTDANRGGVEAGELNSLAREVAKLPGVEIVGLMSVAPLNQEPKEAFSRLAVIRASFLKEFPKAAQLSIGMSDDFEDAINFGATHLRIGSLLLGVRPILR